MVTAKIFAVVAILSALKTIVINILVYFDIKKPLSYINMTGKTMPYALLNLAISSILFFVLTSFSVIISAGKENSAHAISGILLFIIAFPLLMTGATYVVMQYKYIDNPLIKIAAKGCYFLVMLYPITAGLVVISHIRHTLLLANVFPPIAWLFVILAFLTSAVNIYREFFDQEDATEEYEKKNGANWAVLGYGIIIIGIIFLLFVPMFNNKLLYSIAMSIFSNF